MGTRSADPADPTRPATGSSGPCEPASPAPSCTICTIANRLDEYDAMKASFLAAGFDRARCHYRLYDNSEGNRYDPYEVLTSLNREPTAGYVILCHQDVRIDRGDGLAALLDRLQALTCIDPDWFVAGNYGIDADNRGAGRVHDPNGTAAPGPLPRQVVSLDENFIVFRPDPRIGCSPGLSGFHLYGTDFCLNALVRGRSCYVIDFQLSHLSGGRTDGRFDEAKRRLEAAWSPRFVIAAVGTPNAELHLARWWWGRALLRSTKIRRVLRACGVNLIDHARWRRLVPRRSGLHARETRA